MQAQGAPAVSATGFLGGGVPGGVSPAPTALGTDEMMRSPLSSWAPGPGVAGVMDGCWGRGVVDGDGVAVRGVMKSFPAPEPATCRSMSFLTQSLLNALTFAAFSGERRS